MKKEVIFELKALHRDNMRVMGYHFGSGEKSVAIVSGVRGNELQQIYIAPRRQCLHPQSKTPRHIQRLRADGAGGSQNRNCLFHGLIQMRVQGSSADTA